MHFVSRYSLILLSASVFVACKKDKDPVIIVKPSSGAQVELNGLSGTEPGGSGALASNSVYLDLSSDKTMSVGRASWDLGFYSGADFRVVLNHTTGMGAKVLSKTDLNTVGATDTIGLTLTVSQTAPAPSDFAFFDAVNGAITGTVIPAVSATDAANPVVIINRGTAGGVASRAWIKMRVLRNPTGGYTLQYAGIKETTFKTLNVAKDENYHFTFVSFDNGVVKAQPEKNAWDIVWSYAQFETNFGSMVPYFFSDLVAINHLSNVMVKEKVYADATMATAAYAAFNRDSANNTTLVNNRWQIGSAWRSTQPATGVRTNMFYVIKDPNGNYYKLRFVSMGVGSDGGTRGKPVVKYELIP